MNWWEQDTPAAAPATPPPSPAARQVSAEHDWMLQDRPATTAEAPERSWSDWVDDAATKIRQSARGVAGGLMGLPTNLLNLGLAQARTGVRVSDKVREATGMPDLMPALTGLVRDPVQQPELVRGVRGEMAAQSEREGRQLSPKAQAQAQEWEDADGVLESLGMLARNPSFAVTEAVGQLPQLLQAVPGSLVGTVGLQSAGAGSQSAQQVEEEVLRAGGTNADAAEAANDAFGLSTAVNALLPVLIPKGSGLSVERMLAGKPAAGVAGDSLTRRVVTPLVGETVSEFGSGSLDQIIQNVLTGKDALAGAGKAGVLESVVGGLPALASAGVSAAQGRKADAAELDPAEAAAQAAPPAPGLADILAAAVSPQTPAPEPAAVPRQGEPAPVAGTPPATPPVSPVAAVAPESAPVPPQEPVAAPATAEAAQQAYEDVERAAPVGPDRLTELRERRKAAPLTPDEANELIDLQEQDARTARLAGSGMKLPGVKTMSTEREVTAPVRKGFLDLDNFKAINDRIGHSAGDQVIGQVAELLASVFPDSTFHKGGDEFVVHGPDDAVITEGLDRVQNILRDSAFELTDAEGNTQTVAGLGMSYGVGANVDEADAGLKVNKIARRDAGLRTDRPTGERRGPDRAGGQQNEGAGEGAPAPSSGQPQAAQVVNLAEVSAEREHARDMADYDEASIETTAEILRGETALSPDQESEAVALYDLGRRAAEAGTDIEQRDGETDAAHNARLWNAQKESPRGTDTAAAQGDTRQGREGREVEGQPAAQEVRRRAEAGSDSAPAPRAAGQVDSAPTSTKNEVSDAEREARGLPRVDGSTTQSNEETLEAAREELRKNPRRAAEVVAKISNAGTEGISLAEEAILLAEKRRVMNARDSAADTLADPDATAEQKDVARQAWNDAEAQLHEIDVATRAGGSEWGRLGQFRQRLLRQDFTFEALERKRRAVLERPLTEQESAELRAQADTIGKLQERLEASERALEDAKADGSVQATYKQILAEIGEQVRAAAGPARAQPRKRREWLESLRESADEARAALDALESVPNAKTKGQSGAVIDPRALLYLTRIGAFHVANGATTFADWVAAMKAQVGAKLDQFTSGLRDVFKQSKALAKSTAPKGAQAKATPDEVIADINPQKITHADVYRLAMAHVAAGVRGEDAVMRAVHTDLQSKDPAITERDVRRLFSDYGRATFPSKDEDRRVLRELRALVQLQESIDRLAEGLDALKSGPQRDKATAEIREKRRQLNDMLRAAARKSAPSPEKLASYNEARANNLRRQIEDLQKQIDAGAKAKREPSPEPDAIVKRLTAERDRLRAELDALDQAAKVVRTPEQKYQDYRAKSIKRQLADVRKRLADGDYARRPRPAPRKLSEENQRAAYDLLNEKRKFAIEQYKHEMAKRSPLSKIFGGVSETFNLARAMMTSLDLSALLRQGGFISLGRPVMAAKAVPDMLKAFVSDRAAKASEREIQQRENAPLYERAKLELTDSAAFKPSTAEEAFMSRWLENIPRALGGGLLRGSQRSFVTVLNRLRADTFDALVASLAKDGSNPTQAELDAIANYINVATGRGKIGSGKHKFTDLNTVFFAPRLVASRFNLLAGQPLYGGSNRTRALIAQEYARFAMGVLVVMTLAELGSEEDDGLASLDPRSANFLKIKVGNTFLDPMTGLSQVTTFLSRVISGETVTTTGKEKPIRDEYRLANLWRDQPKTDKVPYGGDSGFDVLARFARTKFAPVPGALMNLIEGEDLVGEPVTPANQAMSLITPLSMRDIGGIMEEHGVPKGAAITMLNLLGVGVQHREPRPPANSNAESGASKDPRMSALPEGRRALYSGYNENSKLQPAPDVLAGARNAPQMVMVGNNEGLKPAIAKQFDNGALGVFDPEDGKAYVAMGLDERTAKFVAYHEIAGHYGLQGALGDKYEDVLNKAMRNPTVAKLAEAMKTTGYAGTPNRLARVEEALSDLAAAQRTGDYEFIERERGVKIPDAAKPGLGGALRRVVQSTKRVLADLTGEPSDAYDDDQVHDLLADAWQYVEDEPAEQDPATTDY